MCYNNTVKKNNTITKENSKEEAAKALVNSPELSDISFTLGDREFKVIDLGYDDYLKFITFLTPMLEVFIGSLASVGGVNVVAPIKEINATSIIKYCGESLPEIACIVCTQTDPTITSEEIKKLAKTPFKLCEIVLLQIEKNKIIGDFASFFQQMMPLLKGALLR